MSHSLTLIALFITLPLLLVLTGVAWRFRSNPGAKLFGLLQLLSTIWAALAVLGLQLPPGPLRLQVWGLNTGMSLVVAVLWFAFILRYTGRDDLFTPRQFGIASIPLAIGAGVYFVAPSWTPLVSQVEQVTRPIGTVVQPSVGPVGAILGLYIYAVFLAGLVVVIKNTIEGNSLFVGQALALVLGSLVTIIASFLGVLGIPYSGYPVTEVALAGQSLLWGYAVFGQRFLQVVPAVAAIGERAVFDELDDGVIVVDDSGTVTRANPAARSYFGLEDLVGGTVDPILDRMGVSSLTELPTRFQIRGHTYRAKHSPIKNWLREHVGQAVVIQDITTLSRRQERLTVLNRILRHNVRNDMTVIHGRASQLQERRDDELVTIGETISQKADDLITISDKALEIDRVFETTDVERIDPNSFVEEITSPLIAKHPDASVTTAVSAEAIHTDPGILSLVVEELLVNALEHAGDAPTVTVDISQRDHYFEVIIADDGSGIPRSEIDPILTGEETDLKHASSLGLWLVYWGTQSLNGDLDFTATAEGTSVTIVLPDMESIGGARSRQHNTETQHMSEHSTDQGRHEQKVERYEAILQTMDDVVFIVNEAWTIDYANESALRRADTTLDDLHGTPVMTLADQMVVDEDVPRFQRTLETVFEDNGEFPVRSVLELSLPKGRQVGEYRFSPMRRDGDVTSAIVVTRDITDRVKQKEQLDHRQEQLSLLHGATRDLLSADSPEQVADIASDAAEDILNLRHNGIHFYDAATDGLVPVAVSDASRELLGEVPVIDGGIAWEAFQSGEPRIYEDLSEAENVLNPETPMRSEIILPLDNHGVFIVSSPEAGAFDDSDIELARTLAANTKTAIQRIEKEQKLQTRETELERKNEQLEEFATVVSHDLRNPLNVAQGRLELVQSAYESEHLDAIDRSLDRMETMIDDILTLARQGESVSEFEAVDIDDLTEQCWQTVPTEDATVHVETDARIKGDKTRLQRLFENLFRNAIQHGGDDVRVQIGELDENGFYVADNGPGVPEDKREEVFTDGVSTTNSGSGLGLVIVKEIAEAHGWTISVTVSQDGGAQFEFTGVEFE